MTVHDLRGRLVRVLADDLFAAGEHAVVWDGRDAQGRAAGAGVYFFRVKTANEAAVRKATLLK